MAYQRSRAEEECLVVCEDTQGQYIPRGVRALGGENEILPSPRDTVFAVSHRGRPELSEALRISQ